MLAPLHMPNHQMLVGAGKRTAPTSNARKLLDQENRKSANHILLITFY